MFECSYWVMAVGKRLPAFGLWGEGMGVYHERKIIKFFIKNKERMILGLVDLVHYFCRPLQMGGDKKTERKERLNLILLTF